MTAELTRTLLLIGLATCAAFMAILAFFPWVEFTQVGFGVPGNADGPTFSLNGTELSRIQGGVTIENTFAQMSESCSCKRSFGDGYLIAVLAAVALAFGTAALFFRAATRPLILVAIAMTVATFMVAGYNTIAIWEGVGRDPEEPFLANLDGSVRVELYALTALAGVAAVLGGAALATTTRPVPEEEDIDWDDDITDLEEVSGWA